MEKINRLIFSFLLAAIVCVGCATQKPDPLAGWNKLFSADTEKLNSAIKNDFQEYLQSLSPRERDDARYAHYYEDGEGQHAIRFEVPINGADWAYVLIYDKDNKRIKTIKYVSGHYAS
jgi:hypothetical protein